MMIRLSCGALQGVDAFRVELEVELVRQGLPAFVMVGLAEGAVREAKERVFAALRSCGFRLPPSRITVNLAPADRRKGGSGFDLPLAVALLAAAECLPVACVEGWFMAGELSLGGDIRPVPGVLPLALLARREGARGVITAPENAPEAALAEGVAAYGPRNLTELAAFLTGHTRLEPASPPDPATAHGAGLDFAEVKGQEHAKRAIEIAAAGGHNLLFVGPPGSGKTMLAQRLPSVLPPLTNEEALETTKIYSVAGLLRGGLMSTRPFRAPHHTISDVALVGGGTFPRPGEVSLAHRGVLFLDELPEFGKNTLDVLRQPLEDGLVTVSRAAQAVTFPARCMLVAAMNPCPCGYASDPSRHCVCTPLAVQKYQARVSGPLLDRIDLHVDVPPVPFEHLSGGCTGLDSATMAANVQAARTIQRQRHAAHAARSATPASRGVVLNAALSGALLEAFCALDAEGRHFLRDAMERLHLSARAYTRLLRISRTIADLEGAERLQTEHLAEAVACRVLDRETS